MASALVAKHDDQDRPVLTAEDTPVVVASDSLVLTAVAHDCPVQPQSANQSLKYKITSIVLLNEGRK